MATSAAAAHPQRARDGDHGHRDEQPGDQSGHGSRAVEIAAGEKRQHGGTGEKRDAGAGEDAGYASASDADPARRA